jgi:diaminopimelate decarboxylase
MAVLGVVRDAGIDIEVNSGGELFKALRAGFRPDQIIFNGTSKTNDELDEAVRAGIYSINVDSIYEIGLVEDAVRRARAELNSGLPPARIALRLVPEIGTRSHLGLQTALLTSKFGISSSEVLEPFAAGCSIRSWSMCAGFTFMWVRRHPTSSRLRKLSGACGTT